MSIFVKKNQVVLPGELLATGNYRSGQGVYRERINGKNNFYSAFIGLASIRGTTIGVIPLHGGYIPLENDIVIGIITVVGSRSWMVDIRSPYPALLSVSNVLERDSHGASGLDLSRFLQVGDLILAKVISYDRTRDPVLTMKQRGLKKLVSGRLYEVSPVKIPRIIGKHSSMIGMIKERTRSQIYVGLNGRLVINAPDLETEELIIEVLEKIQAEAHIPGLTDRVKHLLDERLKK